MRLAGSDEVSEGRSFTGTPLLITTPGQFRSNTEVFDEIPRF